MTTVKQSWEGLDNEALRAENDARLKTFTPGTAGFLKNQDYGKNVDGTNKLYSQLTGTERQSYAQKLQDRKKAYGSAYDEVGNKDLANSFGNFYTGTEAEKTARTNLGVKQQTENQADVKGYDSNFLSAMMGALGMQKQSTAVGFLKRMGLAPGTEGKLQGAGEDISDPKLFLNNLITKSFAPGGSTGGTGVSFFDTPQGKNFSREQVTDMSGMAPSAPASFMDQIMNSDLFSNFSTEQRTQQMKQWEPFIALLQSLADNQGPQSQNIFNGQPVTTMGGL
jgi:hypothetical protein